MSVIVNPLLKTPVIARQIKLANWIFHATAMVYTLFKFYFWNSKKVKPSAVIAGIPVPGVAELSGALSDQILRYRARGGIFLAHQDSAGHESLRIIGRAYGPNRFVFLNMLQFLFHYGSTISVDFSQALTNVTSALLPDIATAGVITQDPWVQFQYDNPDEGIEEMHLTFPVITKNRVYINMYIETYQYVESVELGKNVIEYTIFFRKYDAYPKYDFGSMVNPKTKNREYYYKKPSVLTGGWAYKVKKFFFGAPSVLFLSIMYKFATDPEIKIPGVGETEDLINNFMLGLVGGG